MAGAAQRRAYPTPGERHRATGGGADPQWSRDGRRLYYRSGDAIMEVGVETSPGFRITEQPREVVSEPTGGARIFGWDVGPDGKIVVVRGDPTTSRRFQVVHNWFEEVRAKAIPPP